MKRLSIVIIILFIFAANSFAAQQSLNEYDEIIAAEQDQQPARDEKTFILPFAIYYAAVSHTVKHDAGCLDQLLASPQAENIAEFWWGYFLVKCNDYFVSHAPRIAKQEGYLEQSRNMQARCFRSAIYDNWERINATIVKNPQKECIEKKNVNKVP